MKIKSGSLFLGLAVVSIPPNRMVLSPVPLVKPLTSRPLVPPPVPLTANGGDVFESSGVNTSTRTGASALPKNTRALGFVYNFDDNLMKISNVYLFDKVTNAVKAIPTGQFLEISPELGRPGTKWARFEVRMDPEKGSFREFSDAAGVNTFETLVREALKKSKEQWQGKDWKNFAKSLERVATAANVYILTSRQHAPDSILRGLEVLKENGFIKGLPPLANIIPAGNPAFRGPNESLSQAKIAALQTILDRLQKMVITGQVPLAYSRDGDAFVTTPKILTYSDNDQRALDRAAKSLAEEESKASGPRWPDTKIILHNTSLYRPHDLAEMRVVTSDGRIRDYLAGEAEMDSLLKQSAVSKVSSQELYGNPVKVDSPLGSVGDAIQSMFVTHAFAPESSRVKVNPDLIGVEHQWIADFLKSVKPGDEKKHRIVLTRYEIADLGIVDLLIAAKKRGVPVDVITDLNPSYNFPKGGKEKKSNVFNVDQLKSGPIAQATKKLLEAGFTINDDKSEWGIFSQPLHSPPAQGELKIDPIMHEKSLHLVKGNPNMPESVEYGFGTANMTLNPRYNRLFKIDDINLASFSLQHALNLKKVFSQSGEIKDVLSEYPFRVRYKDGSYFELAYTNGRMNPNARITGLINKAITDPEHFQVHEVITSQFVFTNGEVLTAFQNLRKAQPKADFFGVFDDRFVDLYGWGLARNLVGENVYRPYGEPKMGWAGAFRKLSDQLFAYQRKAEGRTIESLNMAPSDWHVWHDKTTIVRANNEGKEWIYVFTGSLNNSNHYENAEMQVLMRIPAELQLAKDLVASIKDVVRAEPEYAIELARASVRSGLAAITGHASIEVPLEKVDLFNSFREKGDSSGMLQVMNEVLALPTTLRDGATRPESEKKMTRFRRLLDAYVRDITSPSQSPRPVPQAVLMDVLTLAAYPQMRRDNVEAALEYMARSDGETRTIVVNERVTQWKRVLTDLPPPTLIPRSGVNPFCLKHLGVLTSAN